MIFMLIYITKDSNMNPFFNSTSGLIVRVCLIAFAGSYWFIGYCLLYILLQGYITLLIINKHYPTFEKIPNLSVQKVNIFKMPEVPAFVMLCMFAGLIYYIGADNGVTIAINTITIQTTTYPFWAVGVAAILVSFSF